MLFNSLPFLVFIAVFFLLWPLARKRNHTKWLWICIMSFVFYGWWDWRFLFLLLGTGTIDYAAGSMILKQPSRKKLWLWLSLGSNIASLVVFKYSPWLASLLDELCARNGLQTYFRESIPEFTLVLPVGISFYTFNSMSYTIDLYRGRSKPAQSLLHFFAFISFFPHLVAGPIIRARDILSQLSNNRHADAVEIWHGIKTCIWGLFQKMVLADNLAVLVNQQFKFANETTSSLGWWICMLAFAFQIYFDFNGYSNIARGIAKLCGIHFRLNFNHPYKATSFRNFWQRWHISLSAFFRDYVYISLGGNRCGAFRGEVNRWITMLLSGLWHGANLTFIAWGALHAFYLTAERSLKSILGRPGAILKRLMPVVVFIGVLVAWVFFRAASIDEAFYIIKCMFSFSHQSDFILAANPLVWLAVACAIELLPGYRQAWFRHPIAESLFWAVIVIVTIYFRGPEQQFIYFQF